MMVFLNGKEEKTGKAIVFTVPFQQKTTTDYVIAKFDCPAKLNIEFDEDVESVTVRPLRYHIQGKIKNGRTVEIDLEKNCNISIEINQTAEGGLLFYGGVAPEVNPDAYENIISFGKGEHFADIIEIKQDNTLVYLEEGAVVNGKILAENRKNIAIDGYGTLTMQNYTKGSGRDTSILLRYCKEIEIRNILVKDSCNWHVNIWGCENVHINNVRLLSYRPNTDGFDICSSRNVLVENCMTRLWDDSLVVKGMDAGDVENVTFRNCVLWNDFARPMEIGVCTRADKMHHIFFENIDVIHSVTGYPIMGIHHGDRAEIYDVKFEDIRIEETPGAQLIDFRITDSVWNKETEKGRIHDVIFRNIESIGKKEMEVLPYHSRLSGYSAESNIEKILFENIRMQGKCARTIEELGVDIYDFVSDVEVISGQEPFIERIKTDLQVNTQGLNTDGTYYVEICVTLENTSNVCKEGMCYVEVTPEGKCVYDGRIVYRLNPKEVSCIKKSILMPAGKFAFRLKGNTPDLSGCMTYKNLDLILSDQWEESAEYRFCDHYGQDYRKVRFALRKDLLMIESELLKSYDFIVYACMPAEAAEGEMLFSVEDTNSGIAPALVAGKDGTILEAPQIGCPEEITFVFENQPKVGEITKVRILKNLTGVAYLPLSQLKIPEDAVKFLMELSIETGHSKRYPLTMFGSQIPEESAHMFVNVMRKADRR